MSDGRCEQRGPITSAQCDKFSWNGHTVHRSLSTGEEWVGPTAAEILDAMLAAYNATAPDASGVMGERP